MNENYNNDPLTRLVTDADRCEHGNIHAPCLTCTEVAMQSARCNADEALARAVSLARRDERESFEQWKEAVTDKAHEYAESNNLCREFDRFMVSIGLRPRLREFTVTVTAEVSVTVTVEAVDEDAASDAVDEYAVTEAIRGHYHNVLDWHVTDVDED